MYPIKLKIEHKFCLLFSRQGKCEYMEKYYKKYTHRDRNIYLCAHNVKRRAALFSQITKISTELFQNLLP